MIRDYLVNTILALANVLGTNITFYFNSIKKFSENDIISQYCAKIISFYGFS